MNAVVDRVLRDHVRYTGDGLLNAPVSAPLPIGDPQSGVFNPTKADIRAAMTETMDVSTAAAAQAALYGGVEVNTVAALVADTALTYTAGQPGSVVAGGYVRTRAEGIAYQVAASGVVNHNMITAGGVKLYAVPSHLTAATRTVLKATPSYVSPAFLAESGREGHFVYDSTVTIAEHAADTLEQEYVAPNPAANGAWKLTGGPRGINVVDAPTRATSFTVGVADFGLLHICTPAAATTLEVTLPAAAANLGKTIAFLVPANTSGRVSFPLMAVGDFPAGNFWIWQRETLTLLATSAGWQILDFQKNPLYLRTSAAAVNTALSTVGANVEISGWVAPTSYDATYLRNYIWALDGGSPQQVIVPRRGKFLLEVDLFITWSGTPPTALYAIVPNAGSGSPVTERRYADYIQRTGEFQAVINLRMTGQNNAGATLPVLVNCTGGTSPIVAGATSAPLLRLSEVL